MDSPQAQFLSSDFEGREFARIAINANAMTNTQDPKQRGTTVTLRLTTDSSVILTLRDSLPPCLCDLVIEVERSARRVAGPEQIAGLYGHVSALVEALAQYMGHIGLAELVYRNKKTDDIPPQVSSTVANLLSRPLTAGAWLGMTREIMSTLARSDRQPFCEHLMQYFFRPGTLRPNPDRERLDWLISWRNKRAHGRLSDADRSSEKAAELLDVVSQVLTDLRFLAEYFLVYFSTDSSAGEKLQGPSDEAFRSPLKIDMKKRTHRRGTLLLAREGREGQPLGAVRLDPFLLISGDHIYSFEYSDHGKPVFGRIGGAQRLDDPDLLGRAGSQLENSLRRLAVVQTPFKFISAADIALAGRQHELDRLRKILREVVFRNREAGAQGTARGQVVMLEGEGGVGKSRLLNSIRSELRERGITPLKVSFDLQTLKLPGWSLRRALEDYLDVHSVEQKQLVETLGTKLSGRLNETEAEFLAGFLRPKRQELTASSVEASDPGIVAFAVDALVQIIFEIANDEKTPGLVILIDDGQYADPLSAKFIYHLADRLRTEPHDVLLAFCVQREELPGNPELLETVNRLGGYSADVFLRWHLTRLSQEETAVMATNALGAALDDEGHEYLYEMSGGNPFYVAQILKNAYFSDLLQPITSDTGERTGYSFSRKARTSQVVPSDLFDAVARQTALVLKHKPKVPGLREALLSLSVLGRSFRRDLAIRFLRVSGALPESVSDPETLLRALKQRRLLCDESGDRQLCFTSGVAHEVAVRLASACEGLDLPRLHEIAASIMVEYGARDEDSVPFLLDVATQYELAGAKIRPYHYFKKAADLARAREAIWDEIRSLERAEALLGGLHACPFDDALRLSRRFLQIGRLEEARTRLDSLARSASAPSDKARALYQLGKYYFSQSQYRLAEETFDHSLSVGSLDLTLREQTKTKINMADSLSHRGRFKDAADRRQAIIEEESWLSKAPLLEIRLRQGLSFDLGFLGQSEAARDEICCIRQLMDRHAQPDNHRAWAYFHAFAGFVERVTGNLKESEECFRKAIAENNIAGDFFLSRVLPDSLAKTLIDAGRYEDAQELLIRQFKNDLEVTGGMESVILLHYVRTNLAHVKAWTGGYSLAREYAGRVLKALNEPTCEEQAAPSSREDYAPLRALCQAIFGVSFLDERIRGKSPRVIAEFHFDQARALSTNLPVHRYDCLLLEASYRIKSQQKERALSVLKDVDELGNRLWKSSDGEDIDNDRKKVITRLREELVAYGG
jgi:tetratricopeptide (TPR) repeat protein